MNIHSEGLTQSTWQQTEDKGGYRATDVEVHGDVAALLALELSTIGATW